MKRLTICFQLDKFTVEQREKDSRTVSNDDVCELAEITAKQLARCFAVRDGWRELFSWAWECVATLRDRGTPLLMWSRALTLDFIDRLRQDTGFRHKVRVRVQQFALIDDRGDMGADSLATEYSIPARHCAPDSVPRVLADFESELARLTTRERAIVVKLVEGHTMKEIGGHLGFSESRVSQLVIGICAKFGGYYPKGVLAYSCHTTDRPLSPYERKRERELSEKSPATD